VRFGRKSLPRRERARHSASSATVTLHVRNLAQLFNSLDASPFWDRDLDHDAADFIEGEFSDKKSARSWHLHVYTLEGAELAADLQAAVEHYYDRLAASSLLKLRDNFRIGQLALLAGISILFACITARQLLSRWLHDVPRILGEGLLILGWVALWRPAEVLAYDWIPLYRKRRLYQRLAGIRVTVRPATPAAAPPRNPALVSAAGAAPRPA
jgi:hypothetical protein